MPKKVSWRKKLVDLYDRCQQWFDDAPTRKFEAEQNKAVERFRVAFIHHKYACLERLHFSDKYDAFHILRQYLFPDLRIYKQLKNGHYVQIGGPKKRKK